MGICERCQDAHRARRGDCQCTCVEYALGIDCSTFTFTHDRRHSYGQATAVFVRNLNAVTFKKAVLPARHNASGGNCNRIARVNVIDS